MDRRGLQAPPEAVALAGMAADDGMLQAVHGASTLPLLEVLGRFMDLAGGDEHAARQLIDSVMAYQRKDLELLRDYQQQQDRQAIARLCHKMAGAACVLKYQTLIASCQQLKDISIDGPWPILAKRAQAVEQALLNLMDICSIAIRDNGPIDLGGLPREH